MTPTKKRLEKEFHGLRKSPADGYHVELKYGEIFDWLGTLHGLDNSPYEGGNFNFYIQFTKEYPEEPPKVNFTTKIYHPNVDGRTGVVSWKMLGEEWHHNNTIEKVLMSLRTLLDHPELESAVEVKIANEYANSRGAFEKHAREWTQRCAKEDSVSTGFT
jgi:ubiquitin-conjugating enzyme E2 D/E